MDNNGQDVKGCQIATLRNNEPLATCIFEAIRTGDLEVLERLLGENPFLSTARFEDDKRKAKSHTLLHVATDWPGHFPNGTAVIATLLTAGADPNASSTGRHSETPLHYAASSNDVQVLDALIDAGADIEATGSVIGGGTPLDDAVSPCTPICTTPPFAPLKNKRFFDRSFYLFIYYLINFNLNPFKL